MFHYDDTCSHNKTSSYTPVRTIEKCFSVLEHIAGRQPVRIPEIVQALGMNRGNVHRLVATLERLGYVERLQDGKIRLSYRIFKMGSTVPRSRKLDEVTRPFMHRLSELSDETVNLGVPYGHSVIYLDKVEAKQYLRLDHQIGELDPLYCTALGKVLLCGFSEEELEDYLASVELRPRTENTIHTREELRKEIQVVCARGYALDLKELDLNLHCIAAPICDHSNRIIAALSISGPSIRFTEEEIDRLIAPMLEIAAAVSREMGCTQAEITTSNTDELEHRA
ncbi:MAG: IclR family transcriptional regulator [Spirochaetales bacterium]|nr:IclR family transcriptional regulator [Spirochaetales bacterium]